MPRLERVQDALNRKTNGPSAQDFVNFATGKALEQMFDRLSSPHVTPEEFQAAMTAVGSGLRALAKQIRAVQADLAEEIQQRPTDFDPVLDAVGSLERSVNRMVDAISAIRLPSVEIPEMPSIDLEPLIRGQETLQQMLASMVSHETSEEEEEPEEAPREWVFDVKRNQAGYIRSVEVRER